MNTDDKELKPCPFCGSDAYIAKECVGEDTLDEVWRIYCQKCPAMMEGYRYEGSPSPIFTDELDAIVTAWNTRP